MNSSKMKYKKIIVFVMFLLFIGIFNITNANSWAGYDDAIALIGGCAAAGFMDKIYGQGSCGLYRDDEIGDCDKCNLNPLQVCSEYQCRCRWKNYCV